MVEVKIMSGKKKELNKPVIETIINTAAIALTGSGVPLCINGNYLGFILILFGCGLEFFKYWGRKKKYW